jgi:hypothetical protein
MAEPRFKITATLPDGRKIERRTVTDLGALPIVESLKPGAVSVDVVDTTNGHRVLHWTPEVQAAAEGRGPQQIMLPG